MAKLCIIGSGFLGTQIGALSARSGYNVSMHDVSEKAFTVSKNSVEEYIDEWITNREIKPTQIEEIKQRINYTTSLTDAVKDADIVIEAVVEKLIIKRDVFRELDELLSPDVIICSNSSSIKISHIEDATKHPERVLNMHFYGYPWRRGVLELMKGTHTTDESIEKARTYSNNIGVYPLIVQKESTGFIFNRVWRAIKKECLTVADTGVAEFMDVDRAWMSLYQMDIGPFGLMDRVGLDVVRDIELVYYNESGDPRDKPPKILLDKIKKGELGVKTGKGFYKYPNPEYSQPEWLHKKGRD
jgi:3-hydroxybutyryl-CoA dehydrogenase